MLRNQKADDIEDDEICTNVTCYKMEVKDSIGLSKSSMFTPCQKKHCERKMKCHLPPLNKILNRKDTEICEVQALPSNWTIVSRPSKIIQDLNIKHKLRHEIVKQEVLNRCQSINQDIEAQIRLKSELLKYELYENRNKSMKLVQTLDVQAEELTILKKSDFEEVENDTLDLLETNRFSINDFYCSLQDLEKLRTQKYKDVLKYEYLELHKVSYQLPYELQKYFEHKILGINQIVLNNLRCYADLQQSLLIQLENNNRLHMQQLNAIRSSWKYTKKREILIKLNEMTLLRSDLELTMLKSDQGKTTSSMLLRKEQDMEQMILLKSSLPLTSSQVEVWSKNTQETIDSIDFCTRKLMTLYKMAVVQVFNGYFEELENVRDEMYRGSLLDSDELNLLNLEVCKPTIECVTQQYSKELLHLEDEWESVITNLQHKLQNTYVFLRQAGLLWDNHYDRLKDLKSIILRDLQSIITKNDKWQNGCEMELSVAIDNLRQAPSQNYLDNLLKDAFKKIDAMKDTYEAHYNAEIKIIEKYQEMVEIESDLLLAELQQILHLFPKVAIKRRSFEEPIKSTRSIENVVGSDSDENTLRHFLSKRTVQLDFQIEAVENWMLGLQEGMETYMASCKYDNTKLANSWIFENRKKLAKRLEVKLAVNISKYERIKISVYDIRLSELKMHNSRIERHKAGAEQEIINVKKHFLSLQIKYQIALGEYKMKVQEIFSKVQTASTTFTIRTLIRTLYYHTQKCKQKVADLFDKVDLVLISKFSKIKKSSIKFCNKMKLFYEGGNFNTDEVKNICKDWKKFEKALKKKTKSVSKEIKNKQKIIQTEIKKDEAKLLPVLTQTLEEFQFNDMIVAMIQNVQVDLKNETYKLKFFIKKTEDQLENVENTRKNNKGKMENVKLFQEEFEKLFVAFSKLSKTLYHTLPANYVRKLNYSHIQITSTVSSKKSKKSKSSKLTKSSSKLTLNPYHDYAGMLFEHDPTNLDSFMPQICTYLTQSLKLVQEESKDFYSKHPKIINKNSIRPSYDDLMREATEKYNFYFIQCELFWLNTVNEFFKLIQVAHKIFGSYFSTFFDTHHKNNMDELQTEHNNFVEKLLITTDTQLEKLGSIRKKLKPLYGYKHNRHLLDKLIFEMEFALEENRTNNFYGEFINPYEEKIQNDLTNYITEYNTVKNIISALKQHCTMQLLNLPLLSQFEERIGLFEFFLEKMVEESVNCTKELSKSFYNKLQYLQIPSDFKLNTKITKTIQQAVYFDTFQNEGSIDFDAYTEIYEEQCKLKLIDIQNIEETWLHNVDTEEAIFNNDIKSICELYTVKYDNVE